MADELTVAKRLKSRVVLAKKFFGDMTKSEEDIVGALRDSISSVNDSEVFAAFCRVAAGYELRLTKERMPHGEFTPFIDRNEQKLGAGVRQCRRWMDMADEVIRLQKSGKKVTRGLIGEACKQVNHPTDESKRTHASDLRAQTGQDGQEEGEGDADSESETPMSGEPPGTQTLVNPKKSPQKAPSTATPKGPSKPEETLCDPHGTPVPEHLTRIFTEVAAQHDECLKVLRAFAKTVRQYAKDDPEGWAYFRSSPFEAAYKTLAFEVASWAPSAVCPYCGAVDFESCKACSTGFANNLRWRTAADELKPQSERKKRK